MVEPCDICDGRRIIRLPVRPKAEILYDPADVPTGATVSYREYPCPQCAPTTTEDRVDIAEARTSRDVPHPGLVNDAGFRDAMARDTAHDIARFLLDRGYIRIEWTELLEGQEYPPPTITVRGTVGVVAPNVVASMEERIAARQEEFAAEVADEAIAQIHNCGSYYGHKSVLKDQAADSVRSAIKIVRNRRAGKTVAGRG